MDGGWCERKMTYEHVLNIGFALLHLDTEDRSGGKDFICEQQLDMDL